VFLPNRCTTDHIFHILQLLEKTGVQRNNAAAIYDSEKREVLYNNLLEIGILKKLVRLTKTCLYETYSKVRVGKFLSVTFAIQNGLSKGDVSPLLLYFALGNAIKGNEVGLELNGTHQLFVYSDDVNLLDDSVNTIKENTETLLEARRYVHLEINADKSKLFDHVSSSELRTETENKDSQ
jgi:hypothetical protein